MSQQRKADLSLIMVTLFWGVSYYLVILCLEELQPMNLNAFRFLLAFLVRLRLDFELMLSHLRG